MKDAFLLGLSDRDLHGAFCECRLASKDSASVVGSLLFFASQRGSSPKR